MSFQHHVLIYNGIPQTLEDWLVESCVVTHSLGGEDSMTLIVNRGIDEAAVFTPEHEIVLNDPNGVCRFRGLLIKPPRMARASEEKQTYEFSGASYYLKRETYEQLAAFFTNTADPTSELTQEYTSRVILNRDVEGNQVAAKAQIKAVLDYAIGPASAPVAYDISAIPALQPPESQELDRRCWDVIQQQLEWMPHISSRWDYTQLPPVLVFGDTVDGHDFGFSRTLDLSSAADGQSAVGSWQGIPRYDLLVGKVRIMYISENVVPGADGKQYKLLTRTIDESEIPNGAYGVEKSTVVLRGAVWSGSEWGEPEPVPALGLAAALHKSFGRLFFEMSWETVRDEVSWAERPGERWNVLGVPGYASAETVCQVITRDIGAGRTSYQCGPPSHLGLGQRLDLLRANRLRQIPDAAGECQYGFKAPDPENSSDKTEIKVRATVQEGEGDEAVMIVRTIAFNGRIES